MLLRWHCYRNLVTAADVSAARRRGADLPVHKIVEFLREETPLTLQYSTDDGATWHAVPLVVEQHPKN